MKSNKFYKNRYLVVIPARGGSKRLPGKNLMELGGVSLIGRAINSVKGLSFVSEICVTTDDDDISKEASLFGPYVHFTRPDSLASDEARTIDVVLHAIDWFEKRGRCFDTVVLLQPTSPLREKHHVKEAVQLFEKKSAQGVISVCRLEHPLEWCAGLGPEGSMEDFSEILTAQNRSQDFGVKYRLNGSVYIYDIEKLKKYDGFFYNDNTYAYEMDVPSSIDIDTHEDYLLASFWQSER